jgi:hypothetical protein
MNLLVFLGGLWPIPALFLLGAIVFGRQAYLAHKSGWKRTDPVTGHVSTGNDPIPYTKIGQFWYGVVLLFAAILFVVGYIISEA